MAVKTLECERIACSSKFAADEFHLVCIECQRTWCSIDCAVEDDERDDFGPDDEVESGSEPMAFTCLSCLDQ